MRSAIPFAGVAQQERRTSRPEVTGLTPVPRSTIAPGFDLVRPQLRVEPLAVAFFTALAGTAIIVVGLAAYAAGWVVRGLL